MVGDFGKRNGDRTSSYEHDHDPDGRIVVHRIEGKYLGSFPKNGFS